MSTELTALAYADMRYALNDGSLFAVDGFTQRLVELAGDGLEPVCDEVLYVLEGTGSARFGEEEHELRPGVSIFASAGTPWKADGNARAISVLVHDPE